MCEGCVPTLHGADHYDHPHFLGSLLPRCILFFDLFGRCLLPPSVRLFFTRTFSSGRLLCFSWSSVCLLSVHAFFVYVYMLYSSALSVLPMAVWHHRGASDYGHVKDVGIVFQDSKVLCGTC